MYAILGEIKYDKALLDDFLHVKHAHAQDRVSVQAYSCEQVACAKDASQCPMHVRNSTDRDEQKTRHARESVYHASASHDLGRRTLVPAASGSR